MHITFYYILQFNQLLSLHLQIHTFLQVRTYILVKLLQKRYRVSLENSFLHLLLLFYNFLGNTEI